MGDFPVEHVFDEPGRPIQYLHFIERGFVSIVANGGRSSPGELDLIGREGVSGIPVLMGADRSPNTAYAQAIGVRFRRHIDDGTAAAPARLRGAGLARRSH